MIVGEYIEQEIKAYELKLNEMQAQLTSLRGITSIASEEIKTKIAGLEAEYNDVSSKVSEIRELAKIQIIDSIKDMKEEEIKSFCEARVAKLSERIEQIQEEKKGYIVDKDMEKSMHLDLWSGFKECFYTSFSDGNELSKHRRLEMYNAINIYLNRNVMEHIRADLYNKLTPQIGNEVSKIFRFFADINDEIENQISLLESNHIPFEKDDVLKTVFDRNKLMMRDIVSEADKSTPISGACFGISCILKGERLMDEAKKLGIDVSQVGSIDINNRRNYTEDSSAYAITQDLERKIAGVYDKKQTKFDQLDGEEQLLLRKVSDLNRLQVNQNDFRKVLYIHFNVDRYLDSGIYGKLQSDNEVYQKLTNIGNKYQLEIVAMNQQQRETLSNDMSKISNLRDEIKVLNTEIANHEKLLGKLNEYANTPEYANFIRQASELAKVIKDNNEIIDINKDREEMLSGQQKELSGKTFVLGKGKKLADLDNQINQARANKKKAQDLAFDANSEIDRIKVTICTMINRLALNECNVYRINNEMLSGYVRELASNNDVSVIISKLKETIENSVKAMNEASQNKANMSAQLCAQNKLDSYLVSDMGADALTIMKSKELAFTPDREKLINMYSNIKSESVDPSEFQRSLDEIAPKIVEELGKQR